MQLYSRLTTKRSICSLIIWVFNDGSSPPTNTIYNYQFLWTYHQWQYFAKHASSAVHIKWYFYAKYVQLPSSTVYRVCLEYCNCFNKKIVHCLVGSVGTTQRELFSHLNPRPEMCYEKTIWVYTNVESNIKGKKAKQIKNTKQRQPMAWYVSKILWSNNKEFYYW